MRTLLYCALGVLAFTAASSAAARGQAPSSSQTQPPAANSQSAPPQQQPKPAPPPKKVWTNDNIDELHGGVSVVGGGSAPAPAGTSGNGSNTTGTHTGQQPLPKEKDPDWYKKQLAPLYTKLDQLSAALANAQSAVSGDTRGSATVSMDATGNAATPQQQLAALQQQQQQVQAQIDNLEDLARHNGIEPGALR